MNVNDNLKFEKELDAEMEAIWENPYRDGIIHYESYKKELVKLLWVLKEPHGDGYRDHRDFFSCPKDFYPKWMNTFGNVMRVSWAILENVYEYSEIPPVNKEDCTIDGSFILEYVAIININKKGGESRTPAGKLEKEYAKKEVKNFLLKQIEFINPRIIINCHRVGKFIDDQLGGNILNKIHGEGYGK